MRLLADEDLGGYEGGWQPTLPSYRMPVFVLANARTHLPDGNDSQPTFTLALSITLLWREEPV